MSNIRLYMPQICGVLSLAHVLVCKYIKVNTKKYINICNMSKPAFYISH